MMNTIFVQIPLLMLSTIINCLFYRDEGHAAGKDKRGLIIYVLPDIAAYYPDANYRIVDVPAKLNNMWYVDTNPARQGDAAGAQKSARHWAGPWAK